MSAYLLDANVWLALVAEGHPHHVAALRFFEGLRNGGAVLCRVAQMGLLRLVTQAAVMGGNPLSVAEALDLDAALGANARVQWAAEPEGLSDAWAAFLRLPNIGAASWTDAYLAAFAERRGLGIASFDRGFERFPVPFLRPGS